MSRLNHFQTRPKVTPINVPAYLEKLGMMKDLPSLNYLRLIHRTHLLKVPIENLDVHFRRKISPDIRAIFKKIIPANRGGLPHENNLLLYHLLTHLGYECGLISANFYQPENGEYSAEYDHMAILVQIQRDLYLCDVGLGMQGIIYPKKLDAVALQMDHNRYFKIDEDIDGNYFLKRTADGLNFETIYRFIIKFREPIEFLDRINFHQTDPLSRYVGNRFISKLTEEGNVLLTDRNLTIVEKGQEKIWPILNDDDFYTKMKECFGISYRSLLHG